MNLVSGRGAAALSYLALALGLAFSLSTALLNLLLGLCALAGLILGWREAKVFLSRHALPVWLGLAIFSLLLLGLTRSGADAEYLSNYKKLLFLPLLWLFFLQDKARIAYFLRGFLIGSVVILTASTLIWLLSLAGVLGGGFAWKGHIYTAAGVMRNAIAQSLLMTFALFLTLVVARIRQQPRWYWLAGWMALNIVVMSPQRTGYLVLLVMLGWFVWNWLNWRGRLAGLLLVLAAGSVLWLGQTTAAARVAQGVNEVEQCLQVLHTPQEHVTCFTSLGMRTFWYANALEKIGAQPWLGQGTGNFGIPAIGGVKFANAHNEYLMQGMQLGVPGMLLYLALLLAGFWSARRLPAPFNVLAGGIMLAYVFGSLFNSFLLDFAEGYALVTVLALILAWRLHDERRGDVSASVAAR